MMGVEAIYAGANCVYYGSGDIHRTPFSGRNSYYFSEDGNFGYYVGAAEAQAMQSVGVNYAAKHFALNDCETMRESVASFATEQAIRESSLRAFEGIFTKGGALGVMCGFNRIGCRYNLTNEHLLTNVLKGEWGFNGNVCGDAWTEQSFQGHYVEELVSGLDYDVWNNKAYAAAIKTEIDGGDGYVLQALRLAAKHNMYASSRTIAVNGLTSNSVVVKITPWWQTAMVVASGVLGAITVLSFAGYVISSIAESGKKEV
jgi:beta-glucosidase